MSRRLVEPLPPRPVSGGEPVAAVVALGANLGDRAATLAAAADDLRRLPLVDEVVVSPAVETVALKPDGPDADAPAYLNAVALVTTRLAPTVLLGFLLAIEKAHGRARPSTGSGSGAGSGSGVSGLAWADRTLDLDLIAYGDVRSDAGDLTLPHPRAHERAFVLEPWLTVDPDAALPGRGRVDALLARLRGRS